MFRIRPIALTFGLLAAGVHLSDIAFAGDPAPTSAPAPVAAPAPRASSSESATGKASASDSAPAPAPAEAEKPATSTLSPVQTMAKWLATSIGTEGVVGYPTGSPDETAWRAWFVAGKDAPLASLRDLLVADGWTADRFVSYFKGLKRKSDAIAAARAKPCSCGGKAESGCCGGTGVRVDGRPCCGGCAPKSDAKPGAGRRSATESTPTADAKPVPDSKPVEQAPTDAKATGPEAPAVPVTAKP